MKGLYFLAGMAIGSIGTYFIMKDRFAAMAQAEIDSVKEAYKEKKTEQKEISAEEPVKTNMEEKPPIKEYFKKISEEGYKDYSTKFTRPEDPAHKPFDEDPYIISPEDFNESDYEQDSLMLYSDGVLAWEENDEIFTDAEEKLGTEFKDHIGDYEDNVVYIRNDVTRMDYAVYKDDRSYEEVTGKKPDPVEEE